MGQITIRVPGSVERDYEIADAGDAKRVIALIEDVAATNRLSASAKPSNLKPSKSDTDEVIGIWKDRVKPDEAIEFARELRKKTWRK